MKQVTVDAGLADRLFDGVIEIDQRGRITAWNLAAQRITGHSPSHVVGTDLQRGPARHIGASGNELADTLVPLLSTLKDGQPRESLTYLTHADGYRLTVLSRTLPVLGRWHKAQGAIQVFTDNRALIAAFQAVQKTEETVLFDPLTGIGNRPHIEMKLRSAIQDYPARHSSFGILFIDIDHFKDFNDSYGHLLGDKILRVVAKTLRQNLRASDSCGRWGGEEFIALVLDLEAAGLAKVAEKLRRAVSETRISDKDGELGVTVSIGASLARPGDTFQSLMERADQLMYESKRLGRNRVTVDS
ncbi:MAG TPA: GGDEF domain-containing protein [Anaerolineales bacterium]|nr:GGDEF domain-containing protein [Anaerolineales bacterium]